LLDEGGDSLAELAGIEGGGRGGDFLTIKMMVGKILESGDERIDGLLAEEKTVLSGMDEVAATTLGKGNHWATGGKCLDRSDTKGLEARKDESAGGLEALGELIGR